MGDLYPRVKEWAIKMGYQGQFPDSMRGVINASTLPFWEQVIQKVKPKDEIKLMRDNILIHTLKGTFKNTIYTQKCNELKLWEERNKMESLVKTIKDRNDRIENEIEELIEQNKLLYERNKNNCRIIKESKQKTHFYNKKCTEIQEEIEKLERMLENIPRHEQVQLNVKDEIKDCTAKILELSENGNLEVNKDILNSDKKFKEKCNQLRYCNSFQDNIIPSFLEIKEEMKSCIKTNVENLMEQKTDKKLIMEINDLSSLHRIHIEAALNLRVEKVKITKINKKIQGKIAFIKNNILDENKQLRILEYINFNMENLDYKSIQSLKNSLSDLKLKFKSNRVDLRDAKEKLVASQELLEKTKSQLLDNLKVLENEHLKLLNTSDEILDLHVETKKLFNNILSINHDLIKILISDEVVWYNHLCFDFNRRLFYTQRDNFLREKTMYYQPIDEQLNIQKLKELLFLTKCSGKSLVFYILQTINQKNYIEENLGKEPETILYKKKEIPDKKHDQLHTRDLSVYLKSILTSSNQNIKSTVSSTRVIYKFYKQIPMNALILDYKLFDWKEFQKHVDEFDNFYEMI